MKVGLVVCCHSLGFYFLLFYFLGNLQVCPLTWYLCHSRICAAPARGSDFPGHPKNDVLDLYKRHPATAPVGRVDLQYFLPSPSASCIGYQIPGPESCGDTHYLGPAVRARFLKKAWHYVFDAPDWSPDGSNKTTNSFVKNST